MKRAFFSVFIFFVALASLICIFQSQIVKQQKQINSYEECIKEKESRIDNVFPNNCQTKDNKYFSRSLVTSQNKQALSSIEISTWKTYYSNSFSFRYPSELLIKNTRNAIMIWGPTTNIGRSFFEKTEQKDKSTVIGPTNTISIDNRKSYSRTVTYNYIYNGDSNRSFADVVHQISIPNISYFSNNGWVDNGVLYLDIHIDGSNPNANAISNSIMKSIKINPVKDIMEYLTQNIGQMQFKVPTSWWFECYQDNPKYESIHCAIDTKTSTQPNRPAEFYIQYFPSTEIISPMIDEAELFANSNKRPILVSKTPSIFISGYIDPNKYSTNAWYGKYSKIYMVKIPTDRGTYIFSTVLSDDEIKENFNKLLSTFIFPKFNNNN